MLRSPIRQLLATVAIAHGLGASSAADTNGLVAAYGFEEAGGPIVIDTSGSGNGGVINGATRTSAGRFGRALSFNGGAMVTVADSPSLHFSNAFTLEAWVYAVELDGWRDVVYKGLDDAYYLEGSSGSGPPALGGQFAGAPLYGTDVLPLNTWVHLAGTYNGTRLRLYVNGELVSSRLESALIDPSTGPLTIGGDSLYGQYWIGKIDEVRVYNRLLRIEEIQVDMITPVFQPSPDNIPPQVEITEPTTGATLSQVVVLAADASDDQTLEAVEFRVDGAVVGLSSAAPFSTRWNSAAVTNGLHTLTAVALDAAGNQGTSAPVQITINNPLFVNELVVPDIVSATTIAFLPDGRMLVGELTEKIWMVQPGANQPDPSPILQLDNSQLVGEQGLMDIAVDPAFSENHYIYVFYTNGRASGNNRNRVSRFTMNGNVIVPETELILWRDLVPAREEHHGGALAIGADGCLYITLGDQFNSNEAQQLDTYHGKVLRINRDGSVPVDNPFYDAAGPNLDEIWALGLRNPYRMSIDSVTGRMFIGDVGGNDNGTAMEEINLGRAGANYGWPLCEGYCPSLGSSFTAPIYAYPHTGRDACVTGGFVYRGTGFPGEYYGNYFFADYVQNWIKRLVLDANNAVVDVVDFEPPDGAKDGPYGDPVKLVEGPDGSIYYVDLGFNDAHVPNPAAIRKIRHLPGNRPPVAAVTLDPSSGAVPLTVAFSSAGSYDPEGTSLSYEWQFGDGASSTEPNPTHVYNLAGQYIARLKLSDGTDTTLSSNLTVTVGGRPVAVIESPADGSTFRGGDIIQFTGRASDAEDGKLPASAFSWSILFHHEGHIHPGSVITNTTSGTLPIPISGHDFQGATSYELVLTVTDSTGLRGSTSVTFFPEKVNLFFDTAPTGLSLDVGGIRKATPFVLDALIGFQYQVSAPQQFQGGIEYQFVSWSDGGATNHTIIVPQTDRSFLATYETLVRLSIERLSDSLIRLHFIGTAGRSYRIQASANLVDWETVGSAVFQNETFEFDDTADGHHRFYRCVTP